MKIKHEFKLKSEMDLASQSESYVHTPAVGALRLPFYLETCGHFYANQGYFTEREGLKNYLIILTIQGCGYIRSKEKEILLARNRAVLIDCMDFQFYQTASDSCWEFLWVHFNGTCAALYCELLNERTIELVDFGDKDNPRKQIEELFEMTKIKYKNLDLQISEKLTSIITNMLIDKPTAIAPPRFEQHKIDVLQAISIIKNQYSDLLTIDGLSKNAHISKFYFVRIFKEFTGQTPYEYLMSYRINESKILLLKSDFSILEISLRCGFLDASNYIRYFKKMTGTTPNSYRKGRGFIQTFNHPKLKETDQN